MITLTYQIGESPQSKVTFFDRDGTLVLDNGFVHKIKDFKWNFQGLLILRLSTLLRRSNFIVSNQSGISRKIFSKEESIEFCEYLQKQAKRKKCNFAAIYLCPHWLDDCECRKPKILTFLKALETFKFNQTKVLMVGNTADDRNYAKNIGAKYIDINSRIAWFKFVLMAFLN